MGAGFKMTSENSSREWGIHPSCVHSLEQFLVCLVTTDGIYINGEDEGTGEGYFEMNFPGEKLGDFECWQRYWDEIYESQVLKQCLLIFGTSPMLQFKTRRDGGLAGDHLPYFISYHPLLEQTSNTGPWISPSIWVNWLNVTFSRNLYF